MIRATLLIPAHNEANVIDRTLLHLSRGLPQGAFRIIVIANACTDATAAKARAVLPDACVIETDTPGKTNALNLGVAAACPDTPIICLDADLDVTAESLLALIAPLEAGLADASCGRMDVQMSGAAYVVRAYYKGWKLNPYFDRGKFGGLFAIGPDLAKTLFPLPRITADDEYIRRIAARHRSAFVAECSFIARAPRTLSSLLAVRRRSLRGAREVTYLGLPSQDRGTLASVLARALRRPASLHHVAVYLAINTWVRLFSRSKTTVGHPVWERDLTTRGAG